MAAPKTISLSEVNLAENTELSNIPLDADQEKGKKKKVPRRIIHFSDGVIEEYSTDEEEAPPPPKTVNPKSLGWFAWVWHYLGTAACQSLAGADFLGEKLAWVLGITSPKYQYALDEYNRLQEEEEEERQREEREEAARRTRESQKYSELEGGPSEKGDQVPVEPSKEGYDNLAMKF